jgi:hypothetical protein
VKVLFRKLINCTWGAGGRIKPPFAPLFVVRREPVGYRNFFQTLDKPAARWSGGDFVCQTATTSLFTNGRRVEAVVTGDCDPGYGSTSEMIAESALCLVHDVQGEGGIWTLIGLAGSTCFRLNRMDLPCSRFL